jgi:hypothetical protein
MGEDHARRSDMLSFRIVVVFIALVGLMFGLGSVADASSHQRERTRSRDPGVEITGRRGAPEMVLQGPVVSVSPATGFIVIRQGTGRNAEEIPIEIDSKTSFMRAGKRASLDEIKTGDRVKVRYSGGPGDVTKTVDVMAGRARGGRG